MRFSTSIVAAVVIGYSLSCVSRGDNQPPANLPSEKPVTILRPVPAVLNEETHPAVQGIETRIKGEAGNPYEFKRAQFVDENHGWAMSEHSLYRTTDGGKTWEWLSQEPEEDARFTGFFFVDESRGWLTTVKHAFTEKYFFGYSSTIMVTEDGGRSWKLQASFPNEVDLSEIRFLNENEGFAVGDHVIDGKLQPSHELFVMRTSNGGKEWNNISEPAKTAIKIDNESPSDSGIQIQWTPTSVLLLTRFGKVISTPDGGKTWELVARFKIEGPEGIVGSPGYRKLKVDPTGKPRAIVAALGKGDWEGDFVINETGGWTDYDLLRTPIFEAVFLSDKEVLACGLNRRPGDEKPNNRLKDAGVILRSFDTGKSWQTIYRSKTFETFFFLTKIKDNEFYAVSDTGTFLRFTLPLS